MNFLQSLRKAFRFIGTLALIFCIYNPSTYAQENQAIGRVLSTAGSVTARDLGGALRELSRRSDIFVGDTVITGPNGFAQLRMVDSAQISFKEDTEFTFSEYSSDGPGGAADSALMEMVRGGFRTISGTIGDDAADDYQVSTQFASIGIRGTTHEAVIDAGSLLTGVYDGGTTISNGQGSLDTGEGANFDYTQTFPGQAPQGLLQQPAQLGNININGGGDNDGDDDDADDGDGDNGDGNDDADDNDGDGDGDDNQNGNDGDDNGAGDGDNADDSNGGIADADNDDAGARAPDNQQNNTPNTDRGNTEVDPTLDTTRTTETAINPVNDVRDVEEFEETGTGTIVRAPDPEPTTDPSPTPSLDPIPAFIQPNTDFLTLVANSGFNSNFTLSELQGVTGRFSEVLAFEGLADIGGGISATAVGDNGATTSITSLTMTFDLNFSASLAQVTNGFLGIKLDDAPQAIAFNIYFDGSIINSQSNFTIGANSNRTQGSQTTSIDLQTSFLNSILVDDSVKQALFSDFFFEDTQGLGVEGQVLIGFATPVLSPADNLRISDRVGFVLSRNAAPGAIFPGNVTELIPGQEVILAGNDLSSPFTLNTEPPYIFRGAGSFLDFTDGTITQGGERPYDFEIGIWGSSSNPVSLYTDFTDRSIFEQIEDTLIVVSVDPAPLAALTGSVVYVSNFDRVLGGSSLGGGISQFFTAFNVDFSAALITDGQMEFCIGGDGSCTDSGSQFWDFDYSGEVVNGFVVARPVDNQGEINEQLASIFGTIEGVFTGDNAEAFVGGFNLFYDDDLDIYRSVNVVNDAASGIPDTTVDGVFLIEKDLRFNSADFDTFLNSDSFLLQEGYARILLGNSRPTLSNPILFVDGRSKPRLVFTDPDNEASITRRNENLSTSVSNSFGLDWERWEGPLTVSTDNLNLSAIQDGANDPIHDVAFFSTFRTSEMHDITGRYETVLGFTGEGDAGTPISDLEMRFDINFSAAGMNNIENGKILIDVGSGQSWLAFFEGALSNNIVEFDILGTNPFDGTEQSGIYNSSWTFLNAIDTADSRMQGAIVDDGSTPALLSSFYFREQAPYLSSSLREAVMGLSLVSLTEDLRFDNSSIKSGGILQNNLDNLGIVILGNPASVTTNINGSGVIQDYIIPVFGSDTASSSPQDRPIFGQYTPTPGTNPYHLSLERVFINQNSSNGADYFDDDDGAGIGGYDIVWGIWNSPGNSNQGLFAYTDRQVLINNENDFNALPWLLVNNPQISSYDGTATYSYVTNFIGGNDTESITGIFTAFDVNFNTAMVSNGSIKVETNTGNLWEANFNASISGASLNSTSLTGTFTQDSYYYYPISGEIAGAFVEPDSGDNTAPYNAFAGGFNFTKNGSESSYFLSGLFLAEREARLTQTELEQTQHHLGIIVNENSVSFGVASHPSSYAGGISPKVALNDRGNQTISTIDVSGPFDEVFTGTSSTVVQSSSIVTDMGYWESTNMSILHNQFNAALTSAISQDVFWANPEAMDIADLTGTYAFTQTGDFVGLSSLNGEIDNFSMAFSVSFSGSGAISSGTLTTGNTAANESWAATFSGGSINGSFVEFTGINGNFSNNSINCSSCITGEVRGVFTEHMSTGIGFTSGFSLNNSGNSSGFTDSTFGIGALSGVYVAP